MEIVLDKNNNTYKYITHFKSKFDEGKIITNLEPIETLNKPKEALWACRTDKDYWIRWYIDTFNKCPYIDKKIFELKDGSRIFTIDNMEDVLYLAKCKYFIEDEENLYPYLDFPNLPFDAIEYNNACIGHLFRNKYEIAFDAWDIECLLVLNPNIILWN